MFPESAPPAVHRAIELLRPVVEGKGFYLAGGTALAFHLGHRRSVDLDFFTASDFDGSSLGDALVSRDGEIRSQEAGTLHVSLRGVKCSFFTYSYPLLESPVEFEGLRLAALSDIAAMKVIAIGQRGTKKDFFDLYEILQHASPGKVKQWVLEKFGERRVNCYHLLRSLVYFADAEADPDPISLRGLTWSQVKTFMLRQEKHLAERFLC
ncbi:nucleotidyl transferase AbiEii/AbiGii toxin family protein [Candidatus Ozemobacteraceae bacterium]|nr:nucleotidyl transferase AbiEii/AbiGii toxin family protein [Candidatus Ozemobacteraceae bacterium]